MPIKANMAAKTKSPKAKPAKTKIEPFDAVIFDIDNVLIDTRESYLEAIRWTIDIFLTDGRVPFFSPSQKMKSPYLISKNDVHNFKLLGGFNDDWDCCYGLLVYLLNLKVKTPTADALKAAINIPAFVKKVKTRPLGVNGIVKMLGRPSAVKIESIENVFQEVYLGKKIYELLNHQKAIHWKKKGLIEKEKLIFRKSTLKKLKEMGVPLGIATGRPRYEALYALKNFEVIEYFDVMTTIDEVRLAEKKAQCSLRKPHPFSVVETAKKIGADHRFVYVGDLPDDVIAAKKAKKDIDIHAIGFPAYAENEKDALKALQTAEPDFILGQPSDLPKLIKAPHNYK